MHTHPALCLHVPVTVCTNGLTLPGELYLTKAARAVRLCILQGESAITARRFGSLIANGENASLTLRSDAPLSIDQFEEIVAWIRSRRLLGSLAVKVVAPPYLLTACHERFLRRAHTASDAADRSQAASTSSNAGICRRQLVSAIVERPLHPEPDLVPA